MHDNMYNHLLLATPFLYRTKSEYLRVAWWLATCARKAKVPGSSPAASYVQR